jgi:hypothetical protein
MSYHSATGSLPEVPYSTSKHRTSGMKVALIHSVSEEESKGARKESALAKTSVSSTATPHGKVLSGDDAGIQMGRGLTPHHGRDCLERYGTYIVSNR